MKSRILKIGSYSLDKFNVFAFLSEFLYTRQEERNEVIYEKSEKVKPKI